MSSVSSKTAFVWGFDLETFPLVNVPKWDAF